MRHIALVSLLKKMHGWFIVYIWAGRQKMVWDSICGGRALGVAAVVLVMAGGAGAATITVNDYET
jgi:hypothetical protein